MLRDEVVSAFARRTADGEMDNFPVAYLQVFLLPALFSLAQDALTLIVLLPRTILSTRRALLPVFRTAGGRMRMSSMICIC